MLLPKMVAREELQGPLIILSGSQEKKVGGGGPLIRACSVIRSNTVYVLGKFTTKVSNIEPNSCIDKYRRNQVSNQHYIHVANIKIVTLAIRIACSLVLVTVKFQLKKFSFG